MVLVFALAWALLLQFGAQTAKADGEIEDGDWVVYDVTTSPILEGEDVPEWMRFEFTNIEGTNATLKATIHFSSGQEQEYSGIIDVTSGSDTGLIISPNLTIGDRVHISGYGEITIEDETTLVYTGVNRTVVKASFSNSTEYYTGSWDKQTGIRLEEEVVRNDTSTGTPIITTTIFRIANTNIWRTRLNEDNLYQSILLLLLVLAVTAISVLFLRVRKKKRRVRSLKRKSKNPIFPSNHRTRSFALNRS